MNLAIEYKNEEDTECLVLKGEVDAFTADNLKSSLLEITERGNNVLVLEMSQVTYMDSTGIGVIIAGYKSSKKNMGRLVVQGLTPRVKRLFDITGLSEIIEVWELKEERS